MNGKLPITKLYLLDAICGLGFISLHEYGAIAWAGLVARFLGILGFLTLGVFVLALCDALRGSRRVARRRPNWRLSIELLVAWCAGSVTVLVAFSPLAGLTHAVLGASVSLLDLKLKR